MGIIDQIANAATKVVDTMQPIRPAAKDVAGAMKGADTRSEAARARDEAIARGKGLEVKTVDDSIRKIP